MSDKGFTDKVKGKVKKLLVMQQVTILRIYAF